MEQTGPGDLTAVGQSAVVEQTAVGTVVAVDQTAGWAVPGTAAGNVVGL